MTAQNGAAFQALSQELKTEFYTSFKESLEELERCCNQLNSRFDDEVVNEMFRAIHSVKGNSHMVFLDDVADVCHRVEDLISLIRKKQITYEPTQGEFMIFILTRLEQLVAAHVAGKSVADDDIAVLIEGVTQVYDASDSTRSIVIQRTMESYSGLLSSDQCISDKVLELLQLQKSQPFFDDLGFMGQIAEIMQSKSIKYRGDIQKVLGLILLLNRQSSQPETEDQLQAAFYFHNLGSKFISSPIFDLDLNSDEWEKNKAAEQIKLSAGFLRVGGKWSEAATIVEQLYERYDGKGLQGLSDGETRNGAKILALVRFYQFHYSRYVGEHGQKVAVAKTLSCLNDENGYRFSPDLVKLLSITARQDIGRLFL